MNKRLTCAGCFMKKVDQFKQLQAENTLLKEQLAEAVKLVESYYLCKKRNECWECPLDKDGLGCGLFTKTDKLLQTLKGGKE